MGKLLSTKLPASNASYRSRNFHTDCPALVQVQQLHVVKYGAQRNEFREDINLVSE